MLVNRATVFLVVLAASIAVAVPSAAPDRRPPRIVSASMLDVDRDSRADRLRLFFSERVRHSLDRDGRYPFGVRGYRVTSVGAAGGRAIVMLLAEKAPADHTARPQVRYARTKAQPVLDRAGNQALAQVFRRVRAHGHAPVATPSPTPPPPPPPAGPPTPTDRDGDGVPNDQDCAPENPAIKPGAPDVPDLAFLDFNCDGIDGTEANAIFASEQGKDTNPGTKAAPKRQIQAAVVAAALAGKDVYAAAGAYERVVAATGVGIYGGYNPDSWSVRRASLITRIVGLPEGVLASNVTGVDLQLLSLYGSSAGLSAGSSAYGIRAINNSRLRLQRVTVSAGNGASGAVGANGPQGIRGSDGRRGSRGACDSQAQALGGVGGGSPVGRHGGKGGNGRLRVGWRRRGHGLGEYPRRRGWDGDQYRRPGRLPRQERWEWSPRADAAPVAATRRRSRPSHGTARTAPLGSSAGPETAAAAAARGAARTISPSSTAPATAAEAAEEAARAAAEAAVVPPAAVRSASTSTTRHSSSREARSRSATAAPAAPVAAAASGAAAEDADWAPCTAATRLATAATAATADAAAVAAAEVAGSAAPASGSSSSARLRL